MTTPARIAVTGATGQLGGRIARRLADAGIAQHLVVRDPTRAPELPGATVAQATFDDAAATRTALTDTPTVLMVSASEDPNRTAQHRTFVDAAVDAGVQHLVYISFYGAAPDAVFTHARDHWETEQRIRSTGIGFTFLRDNMYADFMPALVGEDGAIRGPAGDGRISPVAYDDIAEAATAVLLDPGAHHGRTYDLTGPQALTLDEVAAVLAGALDKPVRYEPETLEQAYASRAHYGAPDWLVDAWVSTYTAIDAGDLTGVSSDVERLTGRPAQTLRAVLTSQV